jgi:hypothetical protein
MTTTTVIAWTIVILFGVWMAFVVLCCAALVLVNRVSRRRR